ncbi:MAG: hypothetical protein V4588_12525 [Pseudomonadota bacterium]
MNWKSLLFVLAIAYGAYQHFHHRPVVHSPGITAPDAPAQNTIHSANSFTHNGYQLTPLADFAIEARVLSVKRYSLGREADLSPVDLALGWGPMSDQAVLEKIDISQGNRFYFWHVDEFFIPREEIETHSANMHMIPADREVEKSLNSIRQGQIVSLRGYLVEARASDGWMWRSSLSRTDTGNGACEVVLVKSISVR